MLKNISMEAEIQIESEQNKIRISLIRIKENQNKISAQFTNFKQQIEKARQHEINQIREDKLKIANDIARFR